MLRKLTRGHKTQDSQVAEQRAGEQGYFLLGAIVAVALVMIALSVAVTAEAFTLRREREEESARRANQYVRAIREYYLKFQHYPGSIEQLENTNNIRFLRQRYVDPLTGKADYRLILVGQNKTTVKGFFGEPLSGLPGAGPGAGGSNAGGAPGSASGAPGTGVPGTSAPGAAGAGATGFGAGASAGVGLGFGAGAGAGGAGIAPGMAANGAPQGTAANGTTGASGTTAPDAAAGSSLTGSGPPGSIGPFMGVGSSATGNSIITVNEQTTYQTWEFLYDPRIERLKAAAALNSGAASGSPLGQNPLGTTSAPTSSTGVQGVAPGNGGTTPAGAGQPTQP